MPREGTKTCILIFYIHQLYIEIRYAPGGDENFLDHTRKHHIYLLRLDMPREGTKTFSRLPFSYTVHY